MPVEYASFVTLHVSDLDRSRRFWVDALGFRVVSHLTVTGRSPSAIELGLDTLHTEGLFVERDGLRVQLQHQDRPPRVALPPVRAQMGLSHFGFRVQDMDGTLAQVAACGGQVVEGARHLNPQYGSEVARILDPDGVRIELLSMPGDPSVLPGVAVAPV